MGIRPSDIRRLVISIFVYLSRYEQRESRPVFQKAISHFVTCRNDSRRVHNNFSGRLNIAGEQADPISGGTIFIALGIWICALRLLLPTPPSAMAIGLNEFKCASPFPISTSRFTTNVLLPRLITCPVSRRGDLDLGAPHRVPFVAPEAMVVGRFLCFTRPPLPRYIHAWWVPSVVNWS